jgi:hypothetical protein
MQQVNLYSEILKQQQQQSGIQLVAASLVVMAFLVFSFSGYLLWDVNATKTELEQVKLTLNQEQAKVNALVAKRANLQPDTSLLTEIDQWQKNVNEAAEALQMLAGTDPVLSKGFSLYLKAFALQANPAVWLTAIQINGENGEVKLEGSTFKPQQIPQTLQQLQSKPALKGLTFAKLTMHQSTKVPGQMDFTLSSSDKNSSDNGHVE